MKNKYINISIGILGWAGFILMLAAMFVPELQEVLFGSGGTLMAATVTGPVSHETTNNALPTHFKRDVSDIIVTRRPYDYPFDTLMRKIGKKVKAKNFKVEWEEVDRRPIRDTVTALYTIVAGTPGETAVISVANAAMWAIDDTGTCGAFGGQTTVVGSTAGVDFRFIVIDVDETNDTITITGLNGFDNANTANVDGNRVPTIASGKYLFRMANAKSELDAQNGEKYQIPSQYYNFCQTYMKQLSESEIESHIKAESGYDFGNKKEHQLWDYRLEVEGTSFFGHRRDRTIGSDRHYTAGGIIPSISNNIEFGSGSSAVDPSEGDVIDLSETLFSANNGSQERYMFAGNTLVSGLAKMMVGNKRMDAKMTEFVAGFKCKTIETTHGIIHIIPSKVLDDYGWGSKAVIVDFEHLIKMELVPMKAVPLELNKSGQSRVINAYRIEETSCVQTRYAGANGVHATWTPAT